MHLSVFAAVFIGVGVLASPALADVPLDLSLPSSGTVGTTPGNPLVFSPSPGSAVGPVITVPGSYGAVSAGAPGTLMNPSLQLVLPIGVYVNNAPSGFSCAPVAHGVVTQERTCNWPLSNIHVDGTNGISLPVAFRVAYLTRKDGDTFQIQATLTAPRRLRSRSGGRQHRRRHQ